MKKHVLALCCATMSCAAMASWVRVAEDPEAIAYYDPASVEHTAHVATLWELRDFRRAATSASDRVFRSAKSQTQYDCAAERGRVIVQQPFEGQMGEGRALDAPRIDGDWEAIDPGSARAAVLAQVCGK
jgi:hypothetical protein